MSIVTAAEEQLIGVRSLEHGTATSTVVVPLTIQADGCSLVFQPARSHNHGAQQQQVSCRQDRTASGTDGVG